MTYSFGRHRVLFSATVSIALLVASCGESKVTQCNKLNKLINQADVATKTAKAGTPSALIRSASQLDQVTSALQAVEVNNDRLLYLQSNFVTLYTEISKSFRSLAAAIQTQDAVIIKSALNFLQQARMKDRELVKQINTYCQQK